jgi:hypothetical protein
MWSYYDWVYCCCRPSVSTICGRIMIGLSLSSVSKHNMWSCYDLTKDNTDNPIIIRPHIVFTDERQRQPNHNTTTYCAYWRTTTTTTQSPVPSLFKQCICEGLLRIFYNEIRLITERFFNPNNVFITQNWHNITKKIAERPHIVFTDERQRQPNHNTTTYCAYWRTTTTTTQS